MTDNIATSVGEMLRAAREKRNETIEQVNLATKISIQVLESLEQDDFESFESDIYLKGFLRNYAKYLGVSEHDVTQAMERQRGGVASVASGPATWDLEEPIREEKLTSPRIFKRFVLPIMIGALVLLLLLFINERRKVRRLTTGSAQGYLGTEVVSAETTQDVTT